MSSARNPGRVVGFWYLLLVLLGPLRLIHLPNKPFRHGDPAATVNHHPHQSTGGTVLLVMGAEDKHDQRVTLRFVEDG